jgi:hypothetical protein
LVHRGKGEPGVGQFVGRSDERAALSAGLERAQSGRGSLFLIGGEPGIGKSRLADEFAQQARALGASVLWGKGWEGAGAPPYWPWIQALRAHLRATDAQVLRRQLDRDAADLARLLPEVGSLIGQELMAIPDSDSARFQLFDSTVNFLRRIAAERTLVLVLDDLHAADTPSILLLGFLASQLGDMQLVAIATYRDIEVAPDHPLAAALHEMAREPTTLLLGLTGLGQADVGRLVEMSAGRNASSQISAGLWRGTSGNPLFIGEAIRLLDAEGRLDDPHAFDPLQVALPASLRQVITRRVRQLGEPTMDALMHGAALGPEFSVDLLRRISGGTAEGLLESLRRASAAGLIAAAGRGRVRFSHDLVREAMYEEIEPGERAALHERIGLSLEALGPHGHLAELAYHFFEAARGRLVQAGPESTDTAAKAVDYAERAGDQAAAALAFEEASRLYRMALMMTRSTPSPEDVTDIELLLRIGESDARAGALVSSREAFLEAANLARRMGLAKYLGRAAIGYGGRLLWVRVGSDTNLIPLLQESLDLLGGEDDRLRVLLLTRLACAWRSHAERRDESDAMSRQAVEFARELGDQRTLALAIIGRFHATWWPDNPAYRLELSTEVVELAERAGDAEVLVDGNLLIWGTLTETGRLGEARRKAEAIRRLADELRQPTHMWLGVGTRTLDALVEGEFDRASELIDQERELIDQEVGTHLTRTFTGDDRSALAMHRFLLARERGGLAEVEAIVRSAAAEFSWYPLHRAALVLLLVELGRIDEARVEFDALAHNGFAAFYRDNEWLLGMSMISEAAALLGAADAAATLYEQLSSFAGRLAIGHPEGAVGCVDRYLGLLAGAMGWEGQAGAHLEAAVRLNDEMGARPWAAHTRVDLASLLRRRAEAGDLERAGLLERQAATTARALGMTVLAERLGAQSARAVVIEPPARPVLASETVFRHEGDVWAIVYAGDSFRIRDMKGLHYLSRLLAEPGREFLALDLALEQSAQQAALSGGGGELRSAARGDAGTMIDAEAKAAYQARMRELADEVAEADALGDAERADRAREELDLLARELARAVGLGGRYRSAASASERARLSVTRAIRHALAGIAEKSKALGEHLDLTVRTGTYCSYRPDPLLEIGWTTARSNVSQPEVGH